MGRPRKNKKSNDIKNKSPARAASDRRPKGSPARILSGPGRAPGPRKAPRQERSRHMVQAILQAAAEVFARLGYARATTNKIAKRAGVSVGSLYQYFPNKDSLLACLFAQHHADVARIVDSSLEHLARHETELEHGLRQLVSELVDLHRADPDLTKALSAAVLHQSPAAEESKQHQELAQHMSELLAARPDVRRGDFPAMAAILGQTTEQLTRWLVHDDLGQVELERAQEEVVQLLLRFLIK